MKRLMMVVLVVASLFMLMVGVANAEGPSAATIAQLQDNGAVGYFATDDGKAPAEIQVSGWTKLSIMYIIGTASQFRVVTNEGVIVYISSAAGMEIALTSYGAGKSFWIYIESDGTFTRYALNDVD